MELSGLTIGLAELRLRLGSGVAVKRTDREVHTAQIRSDARARLAQSLGGLTSQVRRQDPTTGSNGSGSALSFEKLISEPPDDEHSLNPSLELHD
jgi:hypothetical protein